MSKDEADVQHDAAIACRVLAKYAVKFTNHHVTMCGVLPTAEQYAEIFQGGIEVILKRERGLQDVSMQGSA